MIHQIAEVRATTARLLDLLRRVQDDPGFTQQERANLARLAERWQEVHGLVEYVTDHGYTSVPMKGAITAAVEEDLRRDA